MQCIFCGGETESRLVTFVYDEEDDYLIIKKVPAEVCKQCGEKMYAPKVTEVLTKIAKQKRSPAYTVNVPVFEYSDELTNP